MKAWSNPNKRGHRRRAGVAKRVRPRPGLVSDGGAGWIAKTGTGGKVEWTFGYKAHILCDAVYEIPIVIDVTSGNFSDVRKASALLRQMRFSSGKNPKYVLADAGYSSAGLDRLIRNQYRATAIINPSQSHPKSVARKAKIANWTSLYAKRSSVERVNSRMKGFYRLNSIRVRGRTKVMLHALLSAIALEARAIAFPLAIRNCVHKAS